MSTAYTHYSTVIKTFKSQYQALPGDMANATLVWGKNTALCPNDIGAPSPTGTCNGNGDGKVDGPQESIEFWHQLYLSGLTKNPPHNTYNKMYQDNLTNVPYTIFTWDRPVTLLGFTLWHTVVNMQMAWNAGYVNERNVFILAAKIPNGSLTGPVMTPEQAWSSDTKLDDGAPNSGTVQVLGSPECTGANKHSYNLEIDKVVCALSLKMD